MSMHYFSPLGKIRTAVIICCLVLVAGIFGYAYITGNNNSVTEKEVILSNVETLGEKDYGYEYVSSYIKEYGIGNLNSYKINSIEQQLETDFYKELPAEREIAKSTVLLFVEYYYDSTDLSDRGAVTDAILHCLFASIGDPYAYYRTAEEFAEYTSGLEDTDKFTGIGIMTHSETLEVLMVYPDSGAEEAGIRPRDVIYGVDGKTLEDLPADKLLDLIAGEPDTTVNVTVKRGDELIDLVVTRRVLPGRTVYHTITEDNIAVIQITRFIETTYDQFVQSVDYCTENGAVAIVFDVRYNLGGLLDTVAAMIDYVVPDADGRVIASYTHAGDEHVYYTSDGHSVDLPIAVICNERTASASELFAAAFRDYGKDGVLDTVIVGTATYGKGVAQNSYMLYDFSGITYTIGYFNPPCNVNFNGVGVIPDIVAEETEEEDVPLSRALEEVMKLVNTKGNVDDSIGAAA